jgi:hypothetical protein
VESEWLRPQSAEVASTGQIAAGETVAAVGRPVMFEISLIVQIREVAGEKKGRLAVGFAKWNVEELIPKKKWSQYFFDALQRATTQRARNLDEIRRIANEEPPLFREPF